MMGPEISVQDLDAWRTDGTPHVLLDCREPLELQIAALDDVLHIPMEQIPGRLGELEKDATIAVLCHHGVRSLRVTMWLQMQGYTKAVSVRGGIDAWSKVIDPAVPLY